MISNLEIRIAGASQAWEQENIKFNDLVISSLPVTQLLELQVFRFECPTVPFVVSLNSDCGRKPSQEQQMNIEFNDHSSYSSYCNAVVSASGIQGRVKICPLLSP